MTQLDQPSCELDPISVFVYGTLQRGEERAELWPRRPIRIEQATTHGYLFDLGPYPALSHGSDLVLGELYTFQHDELGDVLHVLDRIEGYGQGDVDLYVRRIVICQLLTGEQRRAFAYFYARPEELDEQPGESRRVRPDGDGYCRWRSMMSS